LIWISLGAKRGADACVSRQETLADHHAAPRRSAVALIGTDLLRHISPGASVRQKVEASKEIGILGERMLLLET
jgi:hypothetical protein